MTQLAAGSDEESGVEGGKEGEGTTMGEVREEGGAQREEG